MPDSTRGTPAARQRRLTWRRASRLSRPLRTMENWEKKATSYLASLTLAQWAVILASGQKRRTDSRATWREGGGARGLSLCESHKGGGCALLSEICHRLGSWRPARLGLRLADVAAAEEELAVEVARLYGVHIDLRQKGAEASATHASSREVRTFARLCAQSQCP